MAGLTVPLIAAGAVVVGALVGQASAIVSTIITGRRDRTTAREKRCREAYAAFIEATQGILQSVSGLPPFEEGIIEDAADRALGEVAKLQRAWATVEIVGTEAARKKSNGVKDIASRVANLVQYEPAKAGLSSQELVDLTQELRAACDEFVEVARRDLN
jgi:hypothetical protein